MEVSVELSLAEPGARLAVSAARSAMSSFSAGDADLRPTAADDIPVDSSASTSRQPSQHGSPSAFDLPVSRQATARLPPGGVPDLPTLLAAASTASQRLHILHTTASPSVTIGQPLLQDEQLAEEVSKRHWSVEEDRQLLALVDTHGPRNWLRLAQTLATGRTGPSCCARWCRLAQAEKPGEQLRSDVASESQGRNTDRSCLSCRGVQTMLPPRPSPSLGDQGVIAPRCRRAPRLPTPVSRLAFQITFPLRSALTYSLTAQPSPKASANAGPSGPPPRTPTSSPSSKSTA